MLTTTPANKNQNKKALKALAKTYIQNLKSRIQHPAAISIIQEPEIYRSRIQIDAPYAITFWMERDGETTYYSVVAIPSEKNNSVHIHWSINTHGSDGKTVVYDVKNDNDFEKVLNQDHFLCNVHVSDPRNLDLMPSTVVPDHA